MPSVNITLIVFPRMGLVGAPFYSKHLFKAPVLWQVRSIGLPQITPAKTLWCKVKVSLGNRLPLTITIPLVPLSEISVPVIILELMVKMS